MASLAFAAAFGGRARLRARWETEGRWGGDEFVILFDCALPNATAHIDRTREWVCGNYTIDGRSGQAKLKINASIGLAEYRVPETMKNLLSRADAAMYQHKASSRAGENAIKA